jgi:hypothetical protein
MSKAGGPYLFDVVVIPLAHTEPPVRDAALSHVRAAITGEIEAGVPYPAVIGAHTVLRTYYGHSNAADRRSPPRGFERAFGCRWPGSGTSRQRGESNAVDGDVPGGSFPLRSIAPKAMVPLIVSLHAVGTLLAQMFPDLRTPSTVLEFFEMFVFCGGIDRHVTQILSNYIRTQSLKSCCTSTEGDPSACRGG